VNLFSIIIRTLLVAAVAVLLFYTGWFHLFTLFIWQHPMLSWIPLLAFFAIGYAAGIIKLAFSARRARSAPASAEALESSDPTVATTPATAPTPPRAFSFRWGFLAAALVLASGLATTLFSTPRIPLDDIDYEMVDSLPRSSQPRLLPRTTVDDDPSFRDASEIHLVRDARTGQLLWSGEWQSSWLRGPSSGVSVKSLDTIHGGSKIIRTGFDRSVAGFAPGTVSWEGKWRHPTSRIQYPVIVPSADNGKPVAIAPYVGFRGFPYKTPYFKGVLVYHRDGTVEDLTPEEAAARGELVASGRIYPEALARAEAESLAEELGGEIKDADDNRQPFLTSLDADSTAWVTVVNEQGSDQRAKAVVLQDSSTGRIRVWQPREGQRLVSTRYVIDSARALPIQFETTRCCDSDGHSYTVKLREILEPRLAFKDGRPYYLVTVAPTDELPLSREIEYTLLIDATTGETIRRFDHTTDPNADRQLTAFFR
jgi:hypothetical protein